MKIRIPGRNNARWTGYLLISSLMVCLSCAGAMAAGGDLDTSFGVNGMVTTDFGGHDDHGDAAVIQSDGKIVVAGVSWNGSDDDFAVTRYNGDGSLDTSFGVGGLVTTDIGGNFDWGYAVAIQSDGKIVVAGQAWNGSDLDFAVARYNPDGSLDTSFDGDGMVTTAIRSGDDIGLAVAIQADGKIVVAGASNNGTNVDFAVARYNGDGSLDTSFSGDGKVATAISSGEGVGWAVVIQADGKIVVAGKAWNGFDSDFAMARYNTDGSLDTSFDGDGIVITDFGGDDWGFAAEIQADGKIVVAGVSTGDFAVARYNPDGSLDTSFDGDGMVTTDFGSPYDIGAAAAIQADGKIVVAGEVNIGVSSSNWDFAVARYNNDGSLDTSFGVNGILGTAVGSGDDEGRAVAIQTDGKIVVAGKSHNGSDMDFAVVRYEASPAPPPCPAARPAAPVLTSPAGTVGVAIPTYTWVSDPCASAYELRALTSTGIILFSKWYTAAQVDNGDGTCAMTPGRVFAPGNYRWVVRAKNQYGEGPWSARMYFAVDTTQVVPVAPTLTSPTGTIGEAIPAFDWNSVADTDAYELRVLTSTGIILFSQWYYTAQVDNGDGTCAMTPGWVLPPGDYRWVVRAKNQYGEGPWSARMVFTVDTTQVAPVAPILTSPTGTIGEAVPAFDWNSVADADAYELRILTSDGIILFSKWYTTAQVDNGDGTCDMAPGEVLAPGDYRWVVRAKNQYGEGPWSDRMTFSVVEEAAATGKIPDTGQTTCYDAAGAILNPCPPPCQDFYGQDTCLL